MVGRPAWCHILGEKKVSTLSPNPFKKYESLKPEGQKIMVEKYKVQSVTIITSAMCAISCLLPDEIFQLHNA